MGIKVLLADDSATIKKVMQLTLHDYGVELKAVSSGEDVLAIARSFNPDIAFVDVLLPQKSGYDIASQFKKDGALKQIPVIVLWSSFMDFDEAKYKASGANAKLEKPFEASTLRQLIQQYVPKTSESPIAKHLEFPSYEFDTMTGQVTKAKEKEPVPPAPAKEWNMDAFEDISQYAQKEEPPAAEPFEGTRTSIMNAIEASQELTATGVTKPEKQAAQPKQPSAQTPSPAEGDSEWVRKDLSKFTVPVPQEMGADEGTVSFEYAESEIADTSFLLPSKPAAASSSTGHGTDAGASTPPPASAPTTSASNTSAPTPVKEEPLLHNAQLPSVSPENLQAILTTEIEKLVKEQAKQIVEKIVWKIVPDMASNLIKEELNRLLKDETP
jgi:two-component system, cell cycle response regulator